MIVLLYTHATRCEYRPDFARDVFAVDKNGHAMSVHLYIPAVCASVALFRFPDSLSFAHFGPHFDIHFKGRVQKSALFVCAENMQI